MRRHERRRSGPRPSGPALDVACDSDAELLLSSRENPEAYGEFYARHCRAMLGFFVRRQHDTQTAYDLVAETFAEALASLTAYDPSRGAPTAWLYGIAKNKHR